MNDVSIRYKNQNYSFPLYRDPQTNKKAWRIWDTSILPPMFTTDRPLFSQIPPETEQLIEQIYFYGGMGEEYFDEDSYRYYNSPGADARRKGAVLCGPRVRKATFTTTATNVPITNAGFENGTTGWTNLDGATTDNFWTGASSGIEIFTADGNETFYQDIAWLDSYKGKSFTLSAYGYGKTLFANLFVATYIGIDY